MEKVREKNNIETLQTKGSETEFNQHLCDTMTGFKMFLYYAHQTHTGLQEQAHVLNTLSRHLGILTALSGICILHVYIYYT